MQESFGTQEMRARVKRDTALMKAHRLIDWESLRPLLNGLFKREISHAGGQQPFDPLLMFKATLLGQWHSLSDPKLEHALTVRLDFMHFCGLALTDVAPDESTLCRFRNRLIKAGRMAPLLAAVNKQLQGHGLMVAHATGAVIDATLIASAARPRSQTIIDTKQDGGGGDNGGSNNNSGNEDNSTEAKAQETPQTEPATVTVTHSKSADPDATWLKKGSKSHFGFRTYTTVDEGDGYIRGVHTAPANESEMTHFEQALASADFKPTRTIADKGFASAANRQHLRVRGIKSAIMHKAARNKPLTQRQKNANKAMSKTRYIVEQCFGTMKRLFGAARASYMGIEKVNAQFTLKAMCANLLKAANKILLMPEAKGEIRLEFAR